MSATPTPASPATEAAAVALVERITAEGPISLRKAGDLIGQLSGGPPRSYETVRRYVVTGLHGVRLEAVAGLGGWTTSRDAVVRFLARVHLATVGGQSAPLPGAAEEALAAERNAANLAELEMLARSVGKKKQPQAKPNTKD